MASFMVEKGTLDDIPQLCELLAILFTQEKEFQPDIRKQSSGLRQILERPEAGRILVLRDESGVAGMVNLLFTISTARGGRVCILEDMIVHPAKRGRGAGSMLLREAIACARNEGCSRITLLTDGVNDAAIRFYRCHGFDLSGMVPLRLALSR